MDYTIDDLTAAYVKLRDFKKEIQERHKEELAPINEKMLKVESALLAKLQAEGSESVRTPGGTVYITHRRAYKPSDWDVVLDFILSNGLEHMLERRLSKTAVDEYYETNKSLPPGVAMTDELKVGVRRPANT